MEKLELNEIENKLEYVFKNKTFLETAFSHSSYANTHHIASNERLEFLGDSLLNFITTDFLYSNFSESEGELSKIKAYLVSAENLSAIIEQMDILKFLHCGNFNPNSSKNVKCDLFEAILGAIYKDSDFNTAKKFVIKKLQLTKQHVLTQMQNIVDYKSKLQEFVQISGKNDIEYRMIGKQGKANCPEFEIELLIGRQVISSSKASSKKQAENLCAKLALEKLQK
ncbi:MAG: ribonuclease III [Clostridiales bacterium]|nr:ribonuclease III [Candidatus Apopatousia equi]